MYLMTSTRCGISAKQLERELGVTYKTAYRMSQLIRQRLMTQDAEPFKGGSPVEIDEAYVGGKQRWIGSGRPGVESNKTAVLAMVQRKGRVMAMTVPNVKRDCDADCARAHPAAFDRLYRLLPRLPDTAGDGLLARSHQQLGAGLRERGCPQEHD